ncbi:hypothetical protein PIROE2DRAFT_20425 [Piromyces sp. E2]|nr:hypothetical protein PIROE2DRAFT_20425 [Piromyces sp. E2]|eukprot:OUM64852.1 hypothetical protein PIROE2DRAFT_20425 [Piromyces sp. E2]
MFSNTEKEKTDLSKWIQEDAAVITISCLSLYRPLKLDKKAITTLTNAAGYNNDDENATEISFIKHNSYDSKILPTWNMTQLNMALSNVTPSHSRAWAHETAGSRINDNRYSWKGIDDDFSEKILDFSLEGNNFDVDKEMKKLPNFDTNIWYNVTNSNLSQRRKFTNKTQSHIDRRKIVPEDDLKYTEHYIKVHNFEKQATLDNFLNNNNDNSQTFGSYNSKEPTEIEQRFINSDSIENIYSNSTVDDGFTKSILNNKPSMNNITVVSVTSNTDKQSIDDSIVSEIKNDKSINKSLSSIVTSLSNDTTTNDEVTTIQNQAQPPIQKSKPSGSTNKFSTSTSIPGLNASGSGITAQTSTTVMSSNLSAIHHYQSHGNIQSILQQKSISQIINEGNNNNNNNNNNNANNTNNNNNNSNITANNNTNSLFNTIPGMDSHLNSLTNDANIIINNFSELRTSLSSFFYSLKILNETDDSNKNGKDTKSMNNTTLSSNTSINNASSVTALNETMDNINLQLDISRIHIFLLLNDLNYETYLRQSYLYSIRKLKKDNIAMEYKKNENMALVI